MRSGVPHLLSVNHKKLLKNAFHQLQGEALLKYLIKSEKYLCASIEYLSKQLFHIESHQTFYIYIPNAKESIYDISYINRNTIMESMFTISIYLLFRI